MAIVQISKIQQRAGNLVDLPQLDEAEFGWASDTKRLFIGKTTPNENIEVLTGYSEISFSQIDGSGGGNLNISNAQTGQILTYVDSTNTWINYTGNIEPLGNTKIQLGPVENLKIEGGAIGYVLETDGLGNLSWTPKSTIIAFIQNVTKANPGVVTTTQDNFFTDGAEITITDAAGMTQLNGQSYYANVLTSNTFSLYSDPGLTVSVDTSGFSTYDYTTVTATTVATNIITVGNSALFSLNQEVMFLGSLGNSGLENDTPYYIKTINSGTEVTVSNTLLANGSAGNALSLQTTVLSANMYGTGGRVVSAVSGGGTSAAEGSNTTIQFNNNNILDGDGDFTFNIGVSPKLMSLNGNANVGNLNSNGLVTATRYISNIATGTAPITVTSTTRVANLNVAYSNVTDFVNITTATTGTFYPMMTNALTGNVAEFANSALTFNALTGNLSTTLLNVTTNANIVGNLGVTANAIVNNFVSNNFANVGGNLNVTANANVTGNLNVTANANITANLSANNGAIGNLLTVGANANVTGNLNVTANANIGTNLHLTGTAFVGANANITGNINVTANANVTGNLHLTGVAFLGSNANVTGNLNVTANANITANLASNNAAIGNLLTVGANANVTGNLNVTGNIFGANLYQNGTRVFKYTAANTAPSNPVAGDQWYYIASDILYSYINDGTTSQWVDIFDPSFPPSATSATANTIAQRDLNASLTANIFYGTGVRNTGANATGNIGSSSGYFNTVFAQATSALYADLAEKFETDQVYPVGTVIVIGGEKEATQSTVSHDTKVIGVISDKPSYLMNAGIVGQPIGLTGRVPCRVIGKVRRGDILVTSDIPGVAQVLDPVNHRHGCTFAKALGEWNGEGEGMIEVIVGRN